MKKRGQVWVETVIYTLIAFALIGAVLGFAKPKIEEIQDKAIIEQTIQMLEDINSQIDFIKEVEGNKRLIEIGIKKGTLKIDGVEDELVFELKSRYQYTEPGANVDVGSLVAHTEEKGKFNDVTLTIEFSNYNITYNGKDMEKLLNPVSIPHKLFIENRGDPSDVGKINIDFSLG